MAQDDDRQFAPSIYSDRSSSGNLASGSKASAWRAASVGFLLLLSACSGSHRETNNSTSDTALSSGRAGQSAANSAYTVDPSQGQVTGAPGKANPRQQEWLQKASAFVQQPDQQRDLLTAMRARAITHPAFCQAASFEPKLVDIAFDPEPQFAADGSFTQGTIVYRATMRNCAIPVLMTVYIDAAPGTPLRFRSAVPGTTFADPDLQEKRAIPQALAAARPLMAGCARPMPIDTRLIGGSPSASGTLVPWSEYWLVGGCGRLVNVKLDFTPDHANNQMLVRADPTATRLVRSGLPANDATTAASAAPAVSSPAGGTVVASAIGKSLIPLGGADIPGAKVAGTCLLKLREASPMAPDNAQCVSGLAPRMGATTNCSASKGGIQGSMTVGVTSLDAASNSLTFQCVVRRP